MIANPEAMIKAGIKEWDERPIVRHHSLGVYEHSGIPDIEVIIKECSPFKVVGDPWTQVFGKANVYGSADTVEQILAAARQPAEWTYPGFEFLDIDDPGRVFVLGYVTIDKVNHPGWRWHKNGKYLGTHQRRCEHLGDEEGIEFVLSYQFHELVRCDQ
jgi:hypothetical protein